MWVPQYKDEYRSNGARSEGFISTQFSGYSVFLMTYLAKLIVTLAGRFLMVWKLRYVKQVSTIF